MKIKYDVYPIVKLDLEISQRLMWLGHDLIEDSRTVKTLYKGSPIVFKRTLHKSVGDSVLVDLIQLRINNLADTNGRLRATRVRVAPIKKKNTASEFIYVYGTYGRPENIICTLDMKVTSFCAST